MLKRLLLILTLAAATLAVAQNPSGTTSTVAGLAALTGITSGTVISVTDGNSPTDCTVGGGNPAYQVRCVYNGSTWSVNPPRAIYFQDAIGDFCWLGPYGVSSRVWCSDAGGDAFLAYNNGFQIKDSAGDTCILEAGTWSCQTSGGTSPLSIVAGTSTSIGGSALLAGACASTTVTVTGAASGMVATATPSTYPGDGNYWLAYVSAANTVTVEVCAAVAGTPTASVYNVRVIP